MENKQQRNESYENLTELREDLLSCRKCRDDFGFEPRPITYGNPSAKIMHISQAPGKKVHEIGRPFSDLSGERLRKQWYQITDEQFYNPDNFYFTTMSHCFPGKGNGNYDKKPPRCCWDLWTKREIELMDSADLYLVIGGEAASRLFPGKKLSELVFEDQKLHGKPCFVLPHPSPLNMRWFKANPAFEQERLPVIREKIHEVLGTKKNT